MIRWTSGEKVDPRLLALLESFEEIYVKRRDLFKKIFPGDHDELFQKIGDAISKKKIMKKKKKIMRRSQSIGPAYAVRGRGLDDGIDEFKVERFKVKAPIVIEEDGQGGTTLVGSTKDPK